MKPARRSFLGFLLAAPLAAREALRMRRDPKPVGYYISRESVIPISVGPTISYTLAGADWNGQRKRIFVNGIEVSTPRGTFSNLEVGGSDIPPRPIQFLPGQRLRITAKGRITNA